METSRVIDMSAGAAVVGCPIAGRDVGVDRCLACPRLKSAHLNEVPPTVVCEIRGLDLPGAPPERYRLGRPLQATSWRGDR